MPLIVRFHGADISKHQVLRTYGADYRILFREARDGRRLDGHAATAHIALWAIIERCIAGHQPSRASEPHTVRGYTPSVRDLRERRPLWVAAKQCRIAGG